MKQRQQIMSVHTPVAISFPRVLASFVKRLDGVLRWRLACVVGYHKERGLQDAFNVNYIASQQAGPGDV
ncbi:hypothetical protein D3C85_1578960 [compost metagenome]